MYNWLNFIDYINSMIIISRSELLRFNPFGVGASGAHLPQVSPVAIISLRSLLRFTFNPFGVGTLGAYLPQVSPVAIISLRSLLRFTFNPFGVISLRSERKFGALISYQQNPL
jgi:hypothetical protein